MASLPMLDDDGNPLPLFGFLNAHDAFRRDLPRFAAASVRLEQGTLDADAVDALRQHWFVYRSFLEDHHTFEDHAMFPAVARNEPALKAVIDGLAEQHEELHDLLALISGLLEQAGEVEAAPALQRAFGALRDLVEPHFAAEEEHLVPVMRAAIAAGPGGPPPRPAAPEEEPAVADDYGIPFAVEHLDDRVRAVALPLFPSRPDPTAVDGWLDSYRARVALWAG